MNIWVYFEIERGNILPTSLEALSLAKRLGDVSVVILHPKANDFAKVAFDHGASKAFIGVDTEFAQFSPELFSSTISAAANKHNPDVIILPSTFQSRELTGMLSIDLDCDVLNDATSISLEDDNMVASRPIYEGKIVEKIRANSAKKLVSVRGRMFPMPTAGGATGEIVPIEKFGTVRSTVLSSQQTSSGVSLANANVVIAVGRGITNHPAFGLNEEDTANKGLELASDLVGIFNGALGASRAIVDAGYLPYDHQVGQTGKIISPNVYFGIGISGSIQHIVGMRGSKFVVAVNKDREAPIFQHANYGIVGDLYDHLPALIEKFSALKK